MSRLLYLKIDFMGEWLGSLGQAVTCDIVPAPAAEGKVRHLYVDLALHTSQEMEGGGNISGEGAEAPEGLQVKGNATQRSSDTSKP